MQMPSWEGEAKRMREPCSLSSPSTGLHCTQ